MEIYSENLVPDWWDGCFNPVDVQCSLDFKIVASKIGSDSLWLERKSAIFMNETTSMFLQSFVTIEDGVYRNHAYFSLVKEKDAAVSCPDCPNDMLTFERFYIDATGYGAKVEKNVYSAFHALMLPPFQGQTGYCIGAVFYETKFDGKTGKKKTDPYLVTSEEFCKNVPWRHLIKYAKPYNEYFRAAQVQKFPDKIYTQINGRMRKVVPLYITGNCIGAEILDGEIPGCREYVSFEDYLKL